MKREHRVEMTQKRDAWKRERERLMAQMEADVAEARASEREHWKRQLAARDDTHGERDKRLQELDSRATKEAEQVRTCASRQTDRQTDR